MAVVPAAVSSFCESVARGDEAAARASVAPSAWSAPEGLLPFFRRAIAEPREVLVPDGVLDGVAGRKAAPVRALDGAGEERQRVTLLCDGRPSLIEGVAWEAVHVDCFLAGEAPARIVFEELAPSPEGHEAAAALAAAVGRGLEALRAVLGGAGDDLVAVLGAAAVAGARMEVLDARALPALGRIAVRARVAPLGELYLYASGPPVAWHAQSPSFRASLLLANGAAPRVVLAPRP